MNITQTGKELFGIRKWSSIYWACYFGLAASISLWGIFVVLIRLYNAVDSIEVVTAGVIYRAAFVALFSYFLSILGEVSLKQMVLNIKDATKMVVL